VKVRDELDDGKISTYTRDMNFQKLRQVSRARPFRPFTIHLADGRDLKVSHPELLIFTRDSRTGVLVTAADEIEIFDVPLVTGVSSSRRRAKRA
jgi:hypothetical protein